VFANAGAMSSEQQTASWESLKAAERLAKAPTASHIDGVPATLPALTRAIKISRRAARVGFDWPEASQTAHKVSEELDEVLQAASAVPSPERDAKIAEEVGDLLFAAANLARKFSVDAETALRAANRKFERRFRAMEALATQRGQRFEALDLAAQEALWQDVKRTADAAG
jgi:ATP diphosphatase